MLPPIFSTKTKVSYNQVDPHGRIRNIALMQMLEEAAIEHCVAIERDVFTLLDEGFGWVLLSGALHFNEYPRYNHSIITDTWISGWTRYQGIREFLLKGEDGRIFTRATTKWAYVDARKRRIVPIAESFKIGWPRKEKRALECRFIKRPLEMPAGYSTENYAVRRHDIDSNRHVHNVRYLEWVLETVPEEYFDGRELESVEGSFIHEAHLNDTIQVQAGIVSDNELVHNVVRRSDGEVLSTGRSCWRKP